MECRDSGAVLNESSDFRISGRWVHRAGVSKSEIATEAIQAAIGYFPRMPRHPS